MGKYDDLINRMTFAMKGNESNNGSYSLNITAQQKGSKPPTYAFGTYQFVPHLHLDEIKKMVANSNSFTSIQKKAIADLPSNAEWKKMRDKEWNSQNRKEFDNKVRELFKPLMNNPSIEKEYYTQWMENTIIPTAKKQYEQYGKELGWSLEAFVALNHNRGTSEKNGSWKILDRYSKEPSSVRGSKESVLNKIMDDSNPISPNDYVKGFEDKLGKDNLTFKVFTDKQKKEIISSYEKKKAEILNMEDSQDKTNALDDLRKDYIAAHGEDIDVGKNKGALTVYKDIWEDYKKWQKMPETTDEEINLKADKLNLIEDDLKTYGLDEQFNNFLKTRNTDRTEKAKEFEEGTSKEGFLHKNLQNKGFVYQKDKNIVILKDSFLKDSKEYNEFIKRIPKDQLIIEDEQRVGSGTGYTVNNDYVKISIKDGFNFLDKIDKEYLELTGKDLYIKTTPKGVKNGVAFDTQRDVKNPTDIKTDFSKVIYEELLNTNDSTHRIKERDDYEQRVRDEEAAQRGDSDSSEEGKPLTKEQLEAKNKEFFGDLIVPETNDPIESFEYNENDYKKELPFAAIAQGALGLIGLADAKTEIPLRDEQVSEAIMQMAREQKRLSQLGLKPEEEAAMKANIEDVYSEGVNNIVRASGGNRNIVLGNMEGLNRNRLEGLSTIALADIQRKDAMFAEYGKTLQYIENFNTNRDVANHAIKAEEAQQKKQAGAALAQSGFTNMLNELQYQKENGPGSANHMYKQAMLYKMMGYNPGAKDRGQFGSYSDYINKRNKQVENNAFAESQKEMLRQEKLKFEAKDLEGQRKYFEDGSALKFKQDYENKYSEHYNQTNKWFQDRLGTPSTTSEPFKQKMIPGSVGSAIVSGADVKEAKKKEDVVPNFNIGLTNTSLNMPTLDVPKNMSNINNIIEVPKVMENMDPNSMDELLMKNNPFTYKNKIS